MAHPKQFEKAMIFVDGTNLFYRLMAAKLKVSALAQIFRQHAGGRQIVRMYLYTVEPHFEKAKEIHGDNFAAGLRIVYGEAIPTGDGNFREKGVDALLVADLVYHAAVKNYDFAMLVSVDTDFARALMRVEDFGCRTSVMGVCTDVPERLHHASDQVIRVDEQWILQQGYATRI